MTSPTLKEMDLVQLSFFLVQSQEDHEFDSSLVRQGYELGPNPVDSGKCLIEARAEMYLRLETLAPGWNVVAMSVSSDVNEQLYSIASKIVTVAKSVDVEADS